MLYLFRESLYVKLLLLTPGFPSASSLYVQFFNPYYVKNQALNLTATFIITFSIGFAVHMSIKENKPDDKCSG